MAEEIKPTETKPNTIDTDALTAGITKGLEAALPKAIQPLVDSVTASRGESKPYAAPPTATEHLVSDEEVFAALREGDDTKAATLRRRQREQERRSIQSEMVAPLAGQGGAAISSLTKQVMSNDPVYKRYQKEIDKEIDQLLANYPGTILTPDHYSYARDMVRGRHADEENAAAKEAGLREAREPATPLIPGGSTRGAPEEPKEPTTLAEALTHPNWKATWAAKQQRVGRRSEDEEVHKMGYRDVADYIADRKTIAQEFADPDPSWGLDKNWNPQTKSWE